MEYWFSFTPLRNLCVLGVSAVMSVDTETARVAEDAEVAQRLKPQSEPVLIIDIALTLKYFLEPNSVR